MHTSPDRADKLRVYYRPEMVLENPDASNKSRSPQKPRLLLEYLERTPLAGHLDICGHFAPMKRADFCLAHRTEYVDAFLTGNSPLARSSGLAWSPQFRDSVTYTNGSLYAAIRAACESPEQICLSPTSGFHHAVPHGGAGFCTFSGQAIAALRLYQERRLRGAWIDLDGHEGNSLDATRSFSPALEHAIPRYANLNPQGTHERYLDNLCHGLALLGERVLEGDIDYVAFAHGADSHVDDDFSGLQCTTEEWLSASRLVYGAVRDWGQTRGRPVPLALALFGGYRQDNYDAVLSLHAADLAICLDTLAGTSIGYVPEI
jgi:acetoin utilization deacetylase AcuC-like enzyme